MACICNNTLTASYDIYYIQSSGCFVVTLPDKKEEIVTSCEGELHMNLPTTHDCGRLRFTYQKLSTDPAILPMSTSGNCPCEVSTSGGFPPIYEGRFKPTSSAPCVYWWTLYTTQPTCKIKIVVSKS